MLCQKKYRKGGLAKILEEEASLHIGQSFSKCLLWRAKRKKDQGHRFGADGLFVRNVTDLDLVI